MIFSFLFVCRFQRGQFGFGIIASQATDLSRKAQINICQSDIQTQELGNRSGEEGKHHASSVSTVSISRLS